MPPRPAVAAVWKSGTPSAGRALSDEEQRYVVQVIHHWLVIQMNSPDRADRNSSAAVYA
jgi:hypothetical protein